MDDRKKIEALRKDLFMATANRGLVYTAVLKELRKELGEERASEVFKRAIYNHGVNTAKLFTPPDNLVEFKQWLLDFFPDGGAMNEPEVIRADDEELAVRLPRCPLKEGWRMFGLSDEEVADMCAHADAFDHGFFGSFFDYEMELWSTRTDDACVLHFRPKRTK
ncbi:MAG: L-2-amino-thiazoline-4-carboxylic acid hydrolase [Candidatus Lindowbacteria bacterium]|nr:L-2-amino-thiazoline-4-carboxylic acid hydrolase [Candidatus Lindowbacteria bacterium]